MIYDKTVQKIFLYYLTSGWRCAETVQLPSNHACDDISKVLSPYGKQLQSYGLTSALVGFFCQNRLRIIREWFHLSMQF